MDEDCQQVFCNNGAITKTDPLCVEHAVCVPDPAPKQYYRCVCEEPYTGPGDERCILTNGCELYVLNSSTPYILHS